MSQSLIVVGARFDGVWPWAADHFHALWQEQGDVQFIRLARDDERRVGEVASDVAGTPVATPSGTRPSSVNVSRPWPK